MPAPVLWGSELSIDFKSTEGLQNEASVIAFADGSFLAVWTDSYVGGDVIGQFFAADGTHKGEPFLVTSSPGGVQGAPQAAVLNDGRYVVAWSNSGGTENADDVGVWARIFDQHGEGGNDLYVGNIGFLGQASLSVSALGDGFAISYAFATFFLNPLNVYAYVFDENGTPIASGTGKKVNGPGGETGYGTDIVELDNGHYAVFFEGSGYADGDIRCRVLAATGEEIVPEFRVSTNVSGAQWSPSAARLNDGRIAVVWEHGDAATGDSSGSSIRGRIIDPNDPHAGQDFQVNLTTVGDQGNPQLTALADGGFAVTYGHMPDPINGGGEDIRIASFGADGIARGEITVTTGSGASEPDVTALADGRLLVTWTKWTGDDPNNPKSYIRAQIVDPRGAGVSLTGTSGEDHYIGSAFADHLNGASRHDRLRGESGNDVLNGGAGADTLEGGAGDDIYQISDADTVREAPNRGNDLIIASINFSLMSADHVEMIEAAAGTASISLTGNGLNNTITGNGGANILDGQAGSDLIVGGTGADAMTGGFGNDTLYVDDAGDVVVEEAGQGIDTVYVNTAAYVLSAGAEVEALVADAGALNLTGSNSANTISGNALSNRLWGLAGNDQIRGDLGHDRLYGGTGNDRLSGGVGNDQLKGESGRDVFVFDTRTNKSTNVDKVYDFKSSDDSFHLDNAIFTKLGRASAAGVRFKSDMFVEGTRAKDREDRIVYDKKTGNLYYDQDGTGSKAQVKIATLTNKTKLYWHDFYVI
jgi:Ca2+-binding RTX toxin-like protein